MKVRHMSVVMGRTSEGETNLCKQSSFLERLNHFYVLVILINTSVNLQILPLGKLPIFAETLH